MGTEDEDGMEQIRKQKEELDMQRKALEDQQKELDKEKEVLAQTKKDKVNDGGAGQGEEEGGGVSQLGLVIK